MKSVACLAFCQLAFIGIVFANRFDVLAREATSSTQTSSSPAPAPTSLAAPSSNTTISSHSLSKINSNATTTSGSSNNTSILSTPTPTPTPPTNEAQAKDAAQQCHREDYRMDNHNETPFCFPKDNDKVYVGNEIYFVWDHIIGGNDTTNQITLQYVGQNNSQVTNVTVKNTQGWEKIVMQEKWLEGNSSTNLTFYLRLQDGTLKSGTQFTLVSTKSSRSKKPSKIGMGLGIPIAFAFVAAIVGIFFCMRKRRRAGGYLAKRSLSQGGGRNRAVHSEDDDWSGGTRGPERFRDEPGPGLELQDRSRGHNRDDSIGSLGSSPTHDGFESQGQTGGNAFRDEISRQRDKNR